MNLQIFICEIMIFSDKYFMSGEGRYGSSLIVIYLPLFANPLDSDRSLIVSGILCCWMKLWLMTFLTLVRISLISWLPLLLLSSNLYRKLSTDGVLLLRFFSSFTKLFIFWSCPCLKWLSPRVWGELFRFNWIDCADWGCWC